jgi:uncharacterized membrane protein HdeD (DUF308 family)
VPLKPKYFNPVLARRVFLYPFLDEEKTNMEMNLMLGILFFIIGTILMPLGLKQTSKQKKILLIGASVFSDIIGVLLIFNLV